MSTAIKVLNRNNLGSGAPPTSSVSARSKTLTYLPSGDSKLAEINQSNSAEPSQESQNDEMRVNSPKDDDLERPGCTSPSSPPPNGIQLPNTCATEDEPTSYEELPDQLPLYPSQTTLNTLACQYHRRLANSGAEPEGVKVWVAEAVPTPTPTNSSPNTSPRSSPRLGTLVPIPEEEEEYSEAGGGGGGISG